MNLKYTLTIVFVFLIEFACDPRGETIAQIKITLGPHQTVFDANYAGLNYFPDEPISIISSRPHSFLIVAGNKTILMRGRTFETAWPVRDVLTPGKPGDFDSGYAGITSIVMDDKKILALYHAEDHVGGKISYSPVNRAYWSVGLATADINDSVFTKQGQILTGSVKKEEMKPTDDHLGIGDATIIKDADGRFYFAYFSDLTHRANRGVVIGMARCPVDSGAAPGSWKKFHEGNFNEPGLGGREYPVVLPPSSFPSDVFAPHVTYVETAKKYIMTCNVMAHADHEKQKAEQGGIYYALSDDGIKWSEPQLLLVGHPIPYVGRLYQAHPRLIIEKEQKSHATGWLLYCYSENWGTEGPHKPHYLCRRRVKIEWNQNANKNTRADKK
jgi:hypothetical protein